MDGWMGGGWMGVKPGKTPLCSHSTKTLILAEDNEVKMSVLFIKRLGNPKVKNTC